MHSFLGVRLSFFVCEEFLRGRYDRIDLLSTRYESGVSQRVACHTLLPLCRAENGGDVIAEPDEESVLARVIPQYVAGMLWRAVRESYACEVAARQCAMDSAGKNARTMLDEMEIALHRARQGRITQEITEIVAANDR